MVENRMEGFASSGGGLAARVLRRTGGATGETRRREGPARDGGVADGVGVRSARPPEGAARMAPPSDSPRKKDDGRRAKRMAAVCGVSVALAFVSIAYGTWSAVTSQAAADKATAGAVPTLVASTDIQAGDPLDSSAVEAKLVPEAFRSAAALDVAAWQGEGGSAGARAVVDIPAGSQITTSFVTGGEGSSHLAMELQPGMQAVTVAVDTETGLAGSVRPYDTVRIVSVEGSSAGSSFLETICRRARVVAVGGADAQGGGGDGYYTSVTVEVTPEEADAVRDAQYAGRVSLVLVATYDVLEEEGRG